MLGRQFFLYWLVGEMDNSEIASSSEFEDIFEHVLRMIE